MLLEWVVGESELVMNQKTTVKSDNYWAFPRLYVFCYENVSGNIVTVDGLIGEGCYVESTELLLCCRRFCLIDAHFGCL